MSDLAARRGGRRHADRRPASSTGSRARSAPPARASRASTSSARGGDDQITVADLLPVASRGLRRRRRRQLVGPDAVSPWALTGDGDRQRPTAPSLALRGPIESLDRRHRGRPRSRSSAGSLTGTITGGDGTATRSSAPTGTTPGRSPAPARGRWRRAPDARPDRVHRLREPHGQRQDDTFEVGARRARRHELDGGEAGTPGQSTPLSFAGLQLRVTVDLFAASGGGIVTFANITRVVGHGAGRHAARAGAAARPGDVDDHRRSTPAPSRASRSTSFENLTGRDGTNDAFVFAAAGASPARSPAARGGARRLRRRGRREPHRVPAGRRAGRRSGDRHPSPARP